MGHNRWLHFRGGARAPPFRPIKGMITLRSVLSEEWKPKPASHAPTDYRFPDIWSSGDVPPRVTLPTGDSALKANPSTFLGMPTPCRTSASIRDHVRVACEPIVAMAPSKSSCVAERPLPRPRATTSSASIDRVECTETSRAKRSGGTDGTEYFNATPVLHAETGIEDAASTAKQVTLPRARNPAISELAVAHGEDSLPRRRGLAPIFPTASEQPYPTTEQQLGRCHWLQHLGFEGILHFCE